MRLQIEFVIKSFLAYVAAERGWIVQTRHQMLFQMTIPFESLKTFVALKPRWNAAFSHMSVEWFSIFVTFSTIFRTHP